MAFVLCGMAAVKSCFRSILCCGRTNEDLTDVHANVVAEEYVNPDDYNNDPVLILSGRRQSIVPTVGKHRVRRQSSQALLAAAATAVDPVLQVTGRAVPAKRHSLLRRNSSQKARNQLEAQWRKSSVVMQGASQSNGGGPVLRRMFSLQQSLPRLPVPALQQTIDKFLRSAQPILSQEELDRMKQMTSEFASENGEGPKLQSLLESRAKNSVNWLADWWINTAYLEYRLPCAIHVNPGVMCPIQNVGDQKGQLDLAARVVSGIMDYKSMVDDQSLKVEYMGDQPLCMKQFYSILSSCRIPGKKKDSIVTFPPDQPTAPKHIVVVHNNHFFSVPVYGSDGQILSTKQILEQLQKVVKDSQYRVPPVGILTTCNRNTWGNIHARLKKDKENKTCLDEIQRSIFLLCLDQPNKTDADQASVFASQMNHGNGSNYNSGNRWFDKTIQFIVGRDGSLGLNYEHAPAEGPPIISIVDHYMDYVQKGASKESMAADAPPPEKLKFTFTTELEQQIKEAESEFDRTIGDLDMKYYRFKGFGKNFIKTQKLSPDAFFQVCLQLAYYRAYGQSTATYESGSLRRFQQGRTDTIRSCSVESDVYSKAMDDETVADETKVQLLKNAITSHRKFTADVINGQGVDRHLLGLKLIAIENGMNIPEFLMDPGYTSTGYFKLSTSQVPSKFDAILNFAPVVPDGYGVCYNPMPSQINFCVSAWNSSPETKAIKLGSLIEKSLLDTHDLLVRSQKSKL